MEEIAEAILNTLVASPQLRVVSVVLILGLIVIVVSKLRGNPAPYKRPWVRSPGEHRSWLEEEVKDLSEEFAIFEDEIEFFYLRIYRLEQARQKNLTLQEIAEIEREVEQGA